MGKHQQEDKQASRKNIWNNLMLVEMDNPQMEGQTDLSVTFAELEALPLLVVVQTSRPSCPFQSYAVSDLNQATVIIR